jgi:Xaa-Pro aminopeptidase
MWAKLDQPESVYYDITWIPGLRPAAAGGVERIFGVREARDRAVRRVVDAVSGKQERTDMKWSMRRDRYIWEAGIRRLFLSYRTGHSIGSDVPGTGANMDNLKPRRAENHSLDLFFGRAGDLSAEFGIRSEVNVFVGDGEARVTGEVQDKLF